jgi:hypothetical protein
MPVTHFKQSKLDAQGFILNGTEISIAVGTGTIAAAGPLDIDTGLSSVSAAVVSFNGTPTGTALPSRLEVTWTGGTISVAAADASADASTPISWVAIGEA